MDEDILVGIIGMVNWWKLITALYLNGILNGQQGDGSI